MTEMPNRRDAEHFAKRLTAHAAWSAVVVAAIAMVAPLAASLAARPLVGMSELTALLIASASGLAAVTLSTFLFFDALLFRLIASHDDELAGTAAVDEVLARMRLKPAPLANRSLAERMAGTRRLLMKQRLTLALFVATIAVIVFLGRG